MALENRKSISIQDIIRSGQLIKSREIDMNSQEVERSHSKNTTSSRTMLRPFKFWS